MTLRTTTAKVTGNPDTNGCSQSYDMSPEDPAKSSSHGNLHLVISIKDISDNTQSIFVIRGIAAQIQKKYYESSNESKLKALSDAIESTVETYQREVEISSVVIIGGIANIVLYGTAEVLLKRGEKLVRFTSPNGAIFQSAGNLKDNDLLILATSAFANKTPRGVLNAALERSDPNKIVEFLAPTVQSRDDKSVVCASFINIEAGSQEQKSVSQYPKINSYSPSEQSPEQNEFENKEVQEELKPERPRKSIFSRLRSKRFYIKDFQDEKSDKRRRTFSIAGIALILVLAGTVGYGLHKKNEKERQEKIDQVAKVIQKNLDEAEEIFTYSPQRAQELIDNSKQELQKLEDPDLDAGPQVAALQESIDDAEGGVLGMHSPEANDYLDLNLLSEGFSGNKLAVYQQDLYILDTANKRLITVGVPNKRSEVLAGKDDLGDVKDIAIWSDDVFVLRDDGIYDLENNKLLDSDWSSNTLIESYIGNIYLLDKENSDILRYSIDNGELGSRTSWLTDGVTPDFSKIDNWDIDGAIWLSSTSGAVFKFTFGYQNQSFSLGKAAPELTSSAVLYANSDNNSLYLLDRNNARILVYDREGSYLKQYNQEVIAKAEDIAVFEQENKIILLTGDRLKYIDLE